MNIKTVSTKVLRAVGMLLTILGVVHLAATKHMPSLLNGSPPAVYEQAVGPTLLNHVLVGILLLPLGYTTWLAAEACGRSEAWAKRVLVANTLAVFALPVCVAIFMHRAEFYTSPLFLTGVGLATMTALLMGAATVSALREPGTR